jgi:hypothetical protein
MRSLIPAVALILAAPAAAQQTQCSWVGNVWTCNQQQQPGIDWSRGRTVQPPSDVFAQSAAAGAEARQRDDARRSAKADSALRSSVGARLKAGDCEGAAALALDAGNIDLASQAKAYCAAQ